MIAFSSQNTGSGIQAKFILFMLLLTASNLFQGASAAPTHALERTTDFPFERRGLGDIDVAGAKKREATDTWNRASRHEAHKDETIAAKDKAKVNTVVPKAQGAVSDDEEQLGVTVRDLHHHHHEDKKLKPTTGKVARDVAEEEDDEEDEDEVDESSLAARDPHHKGKKGKDKPEHSRASRDVADNEEDTSEEDLAMRDTDKKGKKHKGKKGKGEPKNVKAPRDITADGEQDDNDAEDSADPATQASDHKGKKHHKGKGKRPSSTATKD